MVLYLRTKRGKTIVDIECWVNNDQGHKNVEISASVDIETYTLEFINTEKTERLKFMRSIDGLSEIRGWMWEVFFMTGKNDGLMYDKVLTEVRKMMGNVASRFGLCVVED